MRAATRGLALAFALSPALAAAAECEAPSSVRVLLHDAVVLGGRLAHLANAPETADGRAAALRTLFEAAACPQLVETPQGARRRNVECIVRGASDDTIVVGANQRFDSVGSAALLPSLAEALAAAPRKHTFRWVAFSPHEAAHDRSDRVPKPQGAMRWLDARSEAERGRVGAMIHVGPVGYAAVRTHPDQATERLACAFEQALRVAKLEAAAPDRPAPDCLQSGAGPRSRSNLYVGCRRAGDWTGVHEWEPFRRAGIPVFGLHSPPDHGLGATLDATLYVKTYRMLAVFLALADEALAPGKAER